MGCCSCITKYSLFLINLAFALAAIALITIGVLAHFTVTEVTELLPVDLTSITISVIVVGCVIFLIAFSGCCGAVGEYRCLLILYAVFLIVAAAGLTYITVVLFGNIRDLTDTVTGWVETAFENNKPVSIDDPGLFVVLERAFNCCGVNGAESYDYLPIIPGTCCPNPVNMTCSASEPSSIYVGCSQLFGDFLIDNGRSLGFVLCAVIALMVVAIVAVLFLNHTITRKNRAGKLYY
ncbi:23 kDa integral membrane protein-like [Pectinophora gossypiella]|uniref:23 kDa integral membrane protein-like n=1 Tax=Pectinophora gossypiella TaxID=13191 RepID=UPI00214EC7FF|nr:23 kDa integral membrane protein-like [Pectinophora gossypiella]